MFVCAWCACIQIHVLVSVCVLVDQHKCAYFYKGQMLILGVFITCSKPYKLRKHLLVVPYLTNLSSLVNQLSLRSSRIMNPFTSILHLPWHFRFCLQIRVASTLFPYPSTRFPLFFCLLEQSWLSITHWPKQMCVCVCVYLVLTA